MRSTLPLLTLCSILLLSPQPVPSQVATRPSLDSLVERVNAYWNLLLASKKLEAVEFVAREGRETFVAIKLQDFSEPRVSALEPSADGTEVYVTVTVKRLLPPAMEWPVRDKWTFREGNWFVTILKASNPFSNGSVPGRPPALSAEEVERRKKAIRDVLQFQTPVLDFGTVRQGRSAPMTLKYRLNGDQAMDMAFRNTPPDLTAHMPERKLAPGRAQSIEMELLTQNYDGRVEEVFTILVRHQEVEIPYEFKLQGFVYTPVSVIPRILRFLKDERMKEIAVRNNSKSEVRIESISSETSGFKLEPLPQPVAPGKEGRFKVIRLADTSEANYKETLALVFATPVEGMANLTLPIVLNYVEQKRKTVPDLPPADIQKLIRQSKP